MVAEQVTPAAAWMRKSSLDQADDRFFPGFPAPPPGQMQALGPGQDMVSACTIALTQIGALFQMLAQEGSLPSGMRGPANLGDYVMSESELKCDASDRRWL